MRPSEVPPTGAGLQVDRYTILAPVCSLCRKLVRAAVWVRRRSTPEHTTRPSSPPPSPPCLNNPPSPDGYLLHTDHSDLVLGSRPPLPPICNRLEEGDVQMVGSWPIRAGGFADLWRGSLEGRQVAIKSYRCYSCSGPSGIFSRFYHEVLVCTQLSHRNIASFIGIYHTPRHPFSLVFNFAEHLDLNGYLKAHPRAKILGLVVGIARGLDHMHDLGVVHGRLETTNVLVDLDGTARIAGLGSALVLDRTTPWSETSPEWLFRGSAPELIYPEKFGLARPHNSKAADIYAFGVLIWEVFSGRTLFSSTHEIVTACKAREGTLPPRPAHPEVTDQVWMMMRRCWERSPSERATIKEVVGALDAERAENPHNAF